MISLPSPSPGAKVVELHLTDRRFEDSETLRLFLEVLSAPRNYDIFKSTTTSYLQLSRRLSKLTCFMDKYDSEKGIELLRLCCSVGVLFQLANASELFVFASTINDLALCFHVIKTFKDWSWTAPDSSKVLHAHPPPGDSMNGSLFRASYAPFEFACSLPFQYQWALTRASLYENPQTSLYKFAHKFVEIAQAIFALNTRAWNLRREVLTSEHSVYGGSFPAILSKPNLEGYTKPKDPAAPSTS